MNWRVGMSRLLIAAIACVGYFFSLPIRAQAPDAGTILQNIKPVPPPQKPSPGLQIAPPPPRPVMPAQPGIKVQVKGFRIVGNTVISDADLQKVVAPYLGKELDLDGLNEA